jgi:hypothetical protein
MYKKNQIEIYFSAKQWVMQQRRNKSMETTVILEWITYWSYQGNDDALIKVETATISKFDGDFYFCS